MEQLTRHRNIVSLYFGGNYIGELVTHPSQKYSYKQLTAAVAIDLETHCGFALH